MLFKKCFAILACSFTVSVANAQYSKSAMPASAVRNFEKGETFLGQNDMPKAAAAFEAAVKEAPGFLDAYLRLGGIYLQTRNFERASWCYEQMQAQNPKFLQPSLIYFAQAKAGSYRFDDALGLIRSYQNIPRLSKADKQKAKMLEQQYDFARTAVKRPVPFSPLNLGVDVNTVDAEYLPSLTIDEQTMVFTRRVKGEDEEFFISHKDTCGYWAPAVNMGEPPNSRGNEGAQNISADGHYLFFSKCERRSPDGVTGGGCDLYMSYTETDSTWSVPKPFKATLNTPGYESMPCISVDNKDLYYVSNREGGQGGLDIWVTHFTNGKWGAPENLGPEINTPYDDIAPFIHFDNQTLYFASEGHPGMGDMDLFVSRRGANGKWGKPVNLGYPINTVNHEGGVVVNASGTTAYYASNRGNAVGETDLYSFELPTSVRPIPVAFIKGTVKDSVSQRRVTTQEVELVDTLTGRVVASAITNVGDGTYWMAAPSGGNYVLSVERSGYMESKTPVDLHELKMYDPIEVDITLAGWELASKMFTSPVYFDYASVVVPDSAAQYLEQIAALLIKYPQLHLVIMGHADAMGSPEAKQKFSVDRARNVLFSLMSLQVPEAQLTAQGFSDSVPSGDNETPEGRALNRRVTFRLEVR
jgi:outer membrane protein OmpA-like peptidoglycan-associated protein